jgi:hypothetical protein
VTTSPPTPPPVRDRGLAVACFLGIVICLLMTAFEFSRAMDGNDRSIAYTFEWPAFAVFIVWMWRKLGSRHDLDDDETRPPEA